jgi:hypothetical protein
MTPSASISILVLLLAVGLAMHLTASSGRASKVPIMFVLCALAVPILTAVLNDPRDNHREIIGVGEIQPTSGDLVWRYFKWGIFEGEHMPHDLHIRLEPLLGWQGSKDAAELLNITNPTPFMITIGFLVIAWIARKGDPARVRVGGRWVYPPFFPRSDETRAWDTFKQSLKEPR